MNQINLDSKICVNASVIIINMGHILFIQMKRFQIHMKRDHLSRRECNNAHNGNITAHTRLKSRLDLERENELPIIDQMRT